ncbi:MAG: hypothetical protein ACI9TH_003230 [Kiritimatiellia bacterium]|jgi:hypothetical protein
MKSDKIFVAGLGLLLVYVLVTNLLKPSAETFYTTLGVLLAGGAVLRAFTLPEKKRPLLAPLFASMIPVMFLWAFNPGQTNARLAFYTLLVVVAGVLLFHTLMFLIFRKQDRAVLATVLAAFVFFTYGHAFDFFWQHKLVWTQWKLNLILSVGYGVLSIAVLAWMFRTKKKLQPVLMLVMTISAIMVGFSAFKLTSHATSATSVKKDQAGSATISESAGVFPAGDPAPPMLEDRADLPDIYYIIPDAYVREDILRRVFSHDNKPFLDWLRGKGFYIADQATSNYPLTFLSLASSLNMVYLDDVIKDAGAMGTSRNLITHVTANNWVGRHLRSKGYRFTQIMTMANATGTTDIADMKFAYVPYWRRNQFNNVFMQTTVLRSLVPSVSGSHFYSFDTLEKVAEIDGPTFLLAHFILPHPPYVFDRNGEVLEDIPLSLHWDRAERSKLGNGYLDQLIYFNTRIKASIEGILAKSKVPPIIIIQADHGWVNSGRPEAPITDEAAWRPHIQERFSILNAYLVPPEIRERLYPSISPVNTFRVVISELFDEDLPLLPDENYFCPDEDQPYNVLKVTHIAQEQ